jgi:RNA polymerase sigma-70 factor (ECF subfamily)
LGGLRAATGVNAKQIAELTRRLRRSQVSTTSVSLLERLRSARPDDPEWHRLAELYQPLIRRWLGRVPGLTDEADDLTQEVFLIMVREIPRFEHQREGSFRAWVRGITVNVLRNHRRRQFRRPAIRLDPSESFAEMLADPNSELAREWDVEHDRHIFEKLQMVARSEFTPASWESFRRFALDGIPAAEVAAELGMSVNAVTLAKSRILKRLREEAGDLLK